MASEPTGREPGPGEPISVSAITTAMVAPLPDGLLSSPEDRDKALERARGQSRLAEAEVHVSYAAAMVQAARPAETLQSLDRANEVFEAIGTDSIPPRLHALSHANAGMALGHLSHFERARLAHMRAVEIAEEADVEDVLYRSRINVGYSHLQLGDTAAAMHAYYTALANPAVDHPYHGIGLVVLADLFLEMGNIDAAKRLIDDAILSLSPRWIVLGEHRIRLAMARILNRSGQRDEAEELLRVAQTDVALTDTIGRAATWISAADMALFNLDVGRLEQCLVNTEELAPDTWFAPTVGVMLVEALVATGDHQRADRYADQLDPDRLPYLSRHRLFDARRQLSIERGDWQSAYHYLERSLPDRPSPAGAEPQPGRDNVNYRFSGHLYNVVDLSSRYKELRRNVEITQTATHDLRTPFLSSGLLIDLLRSQIGPQFNESFDMLSAELDRANAIVDQITKLTLQDPKVVLAGEAHNPAVTIADMLDRFAPIAASKNQTVRFEGRAISAQTSMTSVALAQVLDNLLSNASKYSEPGTAIQVELSQGSPGWVDVSITDQGLGFTSADLARAFGYQQTLSARPTGDEESSGLGLYIVKRILDDVGGQIDIRSGGRGQGTTVMISLPTTDP